MLHHVLFSLRVRAGLSQHDAASRAAISDAYISMIEQGTRLPSYRTAQRLEVAVGDEEHSLTETLHALTVLRGRRVRHRCAVWVLSLLGLLT